MARIAVVGSIAWDEVVHLRERLIAGRHLQADGCGERLGGGAANTGVPLAHAGHHVVLVSAVGTDTTGDRLLAQLAASGADLSSVARVADATTRSLLLIDPDGERTVVNLQRSADASLGPRLDALAADAVYVRSRGGGLAPVLRRACDRALVVAHVPPTGAGERPAHVLVGSLSDLGADATADLWAFARRVAGDVVRGIVLTRGPDGATAAVAGREWHLRAPVVHTRDSTGAGDAFAAGLVHRLAAGAPLEDAVERAVAWGAAAAACDGSILPHGTVQALLSS